MSPASRQLAVLVAALGLLPAGLAHAARQGHPEQGSYGVETTTADLNGAALGKLPRHEEPEEHEQVPPPKDSPTDAPRTAGVRTSTQSSIRATAVTSPSSFEGPNLNDAGAYPPDTQGDVGPTQFIVMINGRVRTYSKATGLPDGQLDAGTDAFWSSVTTPLDGSITQNFTTDPHIRYDPLSGNWYAVMIDVPNDGAATNRIMVAMSDGGTITSSTTWHFYEFSAPAGEFADYPTLGIDANALYIGTNDFSLGGTFLNSSVYVVRKSSLASGPIVVTPFTNVINGSNIGPFTPQGVDNPTAGAATGYFVGVDNNNFGQLDIIPVTTPGATPSLGTVQTLTVPTTRYPANVAYLGQGNDNPLDALDDRLYAAQIRNGHLWTAHNIGVTSAGTSPSNAAQVDRTASRWYDITLGSPSTLNNSGTIYDAAASNPRSYWIPSVAVSGQGTMAIGGTTASTTARPDAWFSSLQPGDAAAASPTLYTSASANYAPAYADHTLHPTQSNRWGDYSLTRVDPTDDQTMWTIQEYVTSTNTWGTRIAKLLAPAPAAPTGTSAANVRRGSASVHVTITGPSGAGWFDPGTGFADRLRMSFSCGATVNGITVNSDHSLDVDLDTRAASKTACNATVTNPDGQSASASALFVADAKPSAVNDDFGLPSNAAYNGTGLLANDTDVDDSSLTAAKASDPSHGTVTVNADGSFTYTPAGGYTGNDSFTYTTSDGLLTSAPATVSLRVINPATNHAPTGVADAVTIPHTGTASGNVLSNDSDSDADPLSAKKLTDPQHGTVNLGSDGSFSYTSAAHYHGTDTFTYAASDGIADSSPVTVTLTGPQDAPPAANADSYSTGQDKALDGTTVLGNDTDDDGDSLTAGLASSPDHGTVSLAPDGTFHYVPAAGFVGSDSFSYTADDGLILSAPATVTIAVAAPAAAVVTPASPSNGDIVPLTPSTPTAPTSPATPSTPKIRCVVPKLHGLTLTAARKALTKAHCRVGKVSRSVRRGVRHGRVLSSSPAAGRRLARGARVALVVRR